jgi:hypothetical protein
VECSLAMLKRLLKTDTLSREFEAGISPPKLEKLQPATPTNPNVANISNTPTADAAPHGLLRPIAIPFKIWNSSPMLPASTEGNLAVFLTCGPPSPL